MISFKNYVVENSESPMHPYLEFLTSNIYLEEDLNENTIIPIQKESPIAKVKRAFDAIGEGKNPHTGTPLPTYGSKEHKEMMKGVAERLREKHGISHKSLLAGNKKLEDSSGKEIKDHSGKSIFTQGMSLAPAYKGCGVDTCPKATTQCRAACLGKTASLNRMKSVQDIKEKKTHALFDSPEDTALAIHDHIHREKKAAKKDGGYNYSVRMNVTSDIPQKVYHGLRKAHSDVQFYDYTKEHKQVMNHLDHKDEEGHKNLHLTFSSTGLHHDESNWKQTREVLRKGGNVAMVSMAKNASHDKSKQNDTEHQLPTHVHDTETHEKWPTLDGDGKSNDLEGHGDARFLDKPGHIAMLHLKGVKKADAANFAVSHDKNRIVHA